ncbi:MAG TPA: ABC transporter permease [Caldilineae bacterium]|nr:ABC transporter permease [Caldilineae bacterium]
MRYRDYLIRRLLYTIPALIGLSMLIFVIARVMPGDPARLALGPEASEEQVQKLREELGLNLPIHLQYIRYMRGVLQGRLGASLYTNRDVVIDLKEYFPATFELVTVAMILSVVVGVPLGIISAVRRDQWEDHVTRIFALSGVSMPRFWIGILFQLVLAYHLGLLPTTGRIAPDIPPPTSITGMYLVDSLITGNLVAFKSCLVHIIMPAVTLALSPIAQLMRVVRASMIEQMRKGYILAARANGMPENLLVYKYMLKNAFIAALTIIGLLYGFFLGGAFVVETVFSWPGMARYGVRAFIYKDFNALIGVVLVIAVAYAVINILVDIAYGLLDPRIRLGAEARET